MENRLNKVKMNRVSSLEDFHPFISENEYAEIQKNVNRLKRVKIGFISATPQGGGVAELLSDLISLMQNMGMDVEWYTIPPHQDFFVVTKKIHNGLHGQKVELTDDERSLYTAYNQQVAGLMDDENPDIWVVEDPQPAGTIKFLRQKTRAIWRYHGDSSNPTESVWDFIHSFLAPYQKLIFSLNDFIPQPIDRGKTLLFPPAINPLNSKNRVMDDGLREKIIQSLGIDASKPFIAQVSRFDPWKDPKGVIDVYRLVKEEFPTIQLVMVGLMLAQDDPEALEIYEATQKYANFDPSIFLFSDPQKLHYGNDFVINTIQAKAAVILQKSVREGFGLVVTEAMWKEKPVVANNCGGIKLQIKNGYNGYLVSNTAEMAEKVLFLLHHPADAQKMGFNAQKTVATHFIITRMLNDYLRVFIQLLQ